jgi:hypothetical protein
MAQSLPSKVRTASPAPSSQSMAERAINSEFIFA